MPLIYSGQEVGLNKRLEFFEKDTINWNGDPSMTELYTKLTALKKDNPALWCGLAGGKIQFLETSAPKKLLAFKRAKGNDEVLVVMNMSAGEFKGTVSGNGETYTDYFSGKKITLNENTNLDLKPWEYHVFIQN